MEVIDKTYSNKLRSLSVLSQDTQAVTVMFLVGVGSRYETESEAGLAHFVEHTLFKGTKKRPSSKQIGTEIESLGGSTNAFTSQDYTGYYIKSPAVNYENTFEILADMFKNPLFDEQEIEKEKGVIVEEIRMYEDRPPSKVSQEWMSNYFTGNNLGKDIAGTIDSVKAMKREQFLQYMNKHYYAENILVVVAGNVEQQQVEDMVTKHCQDIQPLQEGKKASHFTPFRPSADLQRPKQISIEKDVQQTHIVMGGQSIERDNDMRFALQVANAILGEGFGSRLFQVIRDELGLAYYVYSRLMSFNETGVYQIGMGVDSSRADQAMEAVKKQISEVVSGKFSKEEFERAKNYILGRIITDMETTEDIAGYYGMQELLNKEKYTIEEARKRIENVSIEEVIHVSEKIFVVDDLYSAILSR
jgi:predicted Zn-dependent peptidase